MGSAVTTMVGGGAAFGAVAVRAIRAAWGGAPATVAGADSAVSTVAAGRGDSMATARAVLTGGASKLPAGTGTGQERESPALVRPKIERTHSRPALIPELVVDSHIPTARPKRYSTGM